MTFSSLPFADFMKRRSPLFWIAFSLCTLVLVTQVGEWVILRHIERDWPSVHQKKIQKIYSTVQNTFDVYQREAVQTAKKIASSPELRQEISGKSKPDQRQLFDLLQRVERKPETSVEIYDSSGVLLAWWGRTAGLQYRQADVKRETSFVSQGVVYSYLTVVVPVTEGNRGYGSVVLRKIFDVNYPLSKRFISSTGFAQTFPRLLA